MDKKKMPGYPEELTNMMVNYYRKMYSWVGLKDIDDRVASRLKEDEKELARCARIENILSIRMTDYEKHLIVGAGTGGLIVALKEKGVKDVFAIEPYGDALLIAKEKAKLCGVSDKNITSDTAEALPYPDASMDMVHCFTVLEHVRDVRQSIKEMYRVLRPGGLIYINTPDYRNIFEGHYKVHLPLFLGKTINKILLRLYGRNPEFLDSIQFITERQIDLILREEVGHYIRIYERMPENWGRMDGDSLLKSFYKWLLRYIYLKLSIPMNQEIVIRKLK